MDDKWMMSFQDPKMEVLYHIRPYFVGIFPYIGLIYIYMVGTSNQSVPEMAIEIWGNLTTGTNSSPQRCKSVHVKTSKLLQIICDAGTGS